ncbi:MAG: acyl-CoA dehydrogenase family protein, partial [Acidobacteriota bacterium]
MLRGRYAAVHERVLALLDEPEFHYRYDITKAEYRQQVLDWCHRLADAGIGKFSISEELGGEGDMGAFIAAFESLCFFDLSLVVKAGVQFGLFGGSILNLGSKRHHDAYLKDAASLALPGCFAMTETSHGSNVADIETVMRFDPSTDELVITTPHVGARKDYIGNAALHGKLASVFAQLELEVDGELVNHGVHAALVPIRDDAGQPMPGVEIFDNGDKMGLQGVDNGRLHFTGVRVPRENLLDRFSQVDADGNYHSEISSPSKRFFTMLGTLVGGRVSVGLGALSVAKSAMTIAVLYAVKRRQFGPEERPETRLLDYQTHQRRLMPRLARTYALHFALDRLRTEFVESDPLDRREIEAEAAGLKALATWHATDTVQTCRECCGGQGYLAENRFAALKADSDVFSTFEGDNIVLLQLLAKSLLGNFKRQFGRLKPLGLVRWVAERAAVTVTEKNPIATRLTSDEHLLDRDFHRAAFDWR